MFALALAACHDDANLGVGNVQAFVEHLGRNQGAQLALFEQAQGALAFLAADVAGERHDQVLATDGIGGDVVRGEHNHAGFAMAG
jgi:hypothetical protein